MYMKLLHLGTDQLAHLTDQSHIPGLRQRICDRDRRTVLVIIYCILWYIIRKWLYIDTEDLSSRKYLTICCRLKMRLQTKSCRSIGKHK